MTRSILISVILLAVGCGDPGSTTADREREERRVYRACVADTTDVLVNPRPHCREVARQCAYVLGALDEDDVPTKIYNGASR